MIQFRRCELLVLQGIQLNAYQRCGRRGTPSIPDGLAYRSVCPQHRAELARLRAAGLAERLRWAEVEGVRP
ncbi:MAG TPA: hypothetical protein VF486_02405 [Actinomycetes bacterium]